MDKMKLGKFEKIILTALKELESKESDLEDLKAEKTADDLDAAVQVLNQTMRTKLLKRQSLYANKLKEALDRIGDGTYGECEYCSEDINEKRLMARPTATLCVSCKEIEEREERKRKAVGGISTFEPDGAN